MRSILILFYFFLVFLSQATGEEYMLTISDDNKSDCRQIAMIKHETCERFKTQGMKCNADSTWPIVSTKQVIKDLSRFFTDKQHKIDILVPSFTKGHLLFCEGEEKLDVYIALMQIKKLKRVKNEELLDVFIKALNIDKELPVQDKK